MRLSAHTGGASERMRGAGSFECSVTLSSGAHATRDAPESANAEFKHTAAEQEQTASTRGRAQPWHQEDVVVFLSQDGDSEPVYLWRKRPESEESLTSGAVEPSMTAEVKALVDPPGGVERMHNLSLIHI